MTSFNNNSQSTKSIIQNSLGKHKNRLIQAFFTVLICLLALFVSKYYYQLMLIQGESMEPTFHNFQFVIIDKTVKNQALEPGDIIAFESIGLDTVLVKRIAATPGQTVQIIDKTLYINGKPTEIYDTGIFEYAGLLESEITLGEDEYIVIGDNVSESKDSRYEEVGIVDGDSIIGRIK